MTGSIRIIIEGPPEFAAEAVKAILENRENLDRCKPGWDGGSSVATVDGALG